MEFIERSAHTPIYPPDTEFSLFLFDDKVIDDILEKGSKLFSLQLPVNSRLPIWVLMIPFTFPDITAVICF